MYDLIIKNVKIYDGGGGKPFVSDVGVKGDRIMKVGIINRLESAEIIKGEGLCLCPGFVDIHSHSDYYLLIDPLAQSKVRQGVTTEIGGNCGYSAAPISGGPLDERKKIYKEREKMEVVVCLFFFFFFFPSPFFFLKKKEEVALLCKTIRKMGGIF